MHDSQDGYEFKHSEKTDNFNNTLNSVNSYTLPGIIHFLEHQWAKFENERAQWEVEKAELHAKISFLQGERNGQENLKKNLIRRIKMLEYALIQERMQNNDSLDLVEEIDNLPMLENFDMPSKQGKTILEQYLKEIGCSDLIIEYKTQKLRTLIGLGSDVEDCKLREVSDNNQEKIINFNHNFKDGNSKGIYTSNVILNTYNKEMLETETCQNEFVQGKNVVNLEPNGMNEFNYNNNNSLPNDMMEKHKANYETNEQNSHLLNNDQNDVAERTGKTWHLRASLRGHLDGIRCLVFHPFSPNLISCSEDATIKYWSLDQTNEIKRAFIENESIVTFRYHTGPVLCVTFLSSGNYFISGGLDGNVVLWETPPPDFDQYDSDIAASAKFTIDEPKCYLNAHTDAVWCVKCHPKSNHVFSCSADGSLLITVFFDDNNQTSQPIILDRIFPPNSKDDVIDSASSCDILPYDDYNQVAVSYFSGRIVIYDVTSYVPVISFLCEDHITKTLNINMIACHPTLPIIATCHNDNFLRFYDAKSGKCIDKIMSHMDAITCISFDPYGIFYITGSHDNSLRLWNFETKNCLQEITCHRKKFDESVNAVVFHPTLSYMASGGADSLIKLFVLL